MGGSPAYHSGQNVPYPRQQQSPYPQQHRAPYPQQRGGPHGGNTTVVVQGRRGSDDGFATGISSVKITLVHAVTMKKT